MLRKISTSLFHHKYIGKYIAQKLRYAVLYFFLMTVLMIIPSIMILTIDESIQRSEAEAVELLVKKDSGEATIENFKLETTLEYSFETDNYSYAFVEEKVSLTKPTFLFLETEVAYVYYGQLITKISYEELNVENISLNSNSSYGEIEKFISLCESVREKTEIYTKVYEGFINVNMIWLNYFITVVILFFITKIGNKSLYTKHRFIIAFYAVTSNIVCDFFTVVTGMYILKMLGLILSGIAAYRASKAIVSVREI